MVNKILLLVFILSAGNVIGQNYYPIKPDSVSENTFNYYKSRLDKAYDKKDLWYVGVYLANMGEKPEKVFKTLNEAILENPKKHCFIVHMSHHTYKDQETPKLITTLDKLDKNEVNKIWESCKVLMDSMEYMEIYNELAYRNQSRFLNIDSSKLDLTLILRLENIFEKDQKYRDFSNKGLSEKQRQLDKENLIEIEQIIRERGLPSIAEVGDLSYIPWLILHHCPDMKKKEKYLPLLEQQVSKGDLTKRQLELYKHRMKLYYSKK